MSKIVNVVLLVDIVPLLGVLDSQPLVPRG